MSEIQRLSSEEVAARWSRHGDELRQFLRALLRDEQLAADALQTTFARLIERGHESAEDRRRAWLFQVAYREAMELRRGDRRRDRLIDAFRRRPDVPGLSPQGDAPGDSLVRREDLTRLRAAIEALPTEQREVLIRKAYEEKTFQQIADELGIPLGTALTRMRAAVLRLKRLLDET